MGESMTPFNKGDQGRSHGKIGVIVGAISEKDIYDRRYLVKFPKRFLWKKWDKYMTIEEYSLEKLYDGLTKEQSIKKQLIEDDKKCSKH